MFRIYGHATREALVHAGHPRMPYRYTKGKRAFFFSLRAQISALVKLQWLCVPTSFLFSVFEHFSFDECWLECFLTHHFWEKAHASLLHFQEAALGTLDVLPASLNIFLRVLNGNQLTGSIPPQISALIALDPNFAVRFSYVHLSVFAI